MSLCRCPHCNATFQVNIPPTSQFWADAPCDDEGLTLWVCMECHQRGLPAVRGDDDRNLGHDSSHPMPTSESWRWRDEQHPR